MGNGAQLRISVPTGTGEAPTELAAFDRALLDAGIANHNLIALSSTIPPGAEVREKGAPEADTWGQVLDVVLAQQRESRVGVEAWAGLGWVQDEQTGRGMFVEHEGGNRRSVEAQIEASLDSMIASRAMSVPYRPPSPAAPATFSPCAPLSSPSTGRRTRGKTAPRSRVPPSRA